MARMGRPGMSDAQKDEVWCRWRSGASLSDIGRAVGKHPASVFGVLRLHGGFRPPARKRSISALTLAEREELSKGLSAGYSMRQMARALHRSPSTISREIARNGGPQRYRAYQADDKAWDRACRPKLCRLWSGHPNRSLAGSSVPMPRMRACTCRTKRFIGVFLFRPVAC